MSKDYSDKKEKIADRYGLPKDIVLGASIMSVTGNSRLLIENFKSLLEYNSEMVLIQCKNYTVIIKGKRLEIALYTKEEISIHGTIMEIIYK